MKKFMILCTILAFTFASDASAKGGHGGGHSSHAATGTGSSHSKTHVSGYTKRNGTHVAAHNKSTKDHTKANNWSTKGNVNPETGKAGTK